MLFVNSSDMFISNNGDDINGNGTIENPFKTLRKASLTAKPGDTIYIRGGGYGRDIIVAEGTLDQPILFRNYQNEIPRFRSDDPGEAAIVIYGKYCNIEGIQINSSIHGGIILWNARDISISNCSIEKCQRGGIYVGGTLNKTNYTNITLENNTITNTCLVRQKDEEDDDVSAPAALVVTKADGVKIIKNTIHNNFGEGIIVSNSINGAISQNVIYDNIEAGIYLDNCGHINIERNYIYSSGKTKYFNNDLPMSGIILANNDRDLFINTDTISIINNIITKYAYGVMYNNRGKSSGIHNCFIANNTFYRGYREAIRIMTSKVLSSNNEIVNNIFDHSKAYKPIDGVDAEVRMGFKFHHNGWSHPPSYIVGANEVIGASRLLLTNRYYDFADPALQFKLKENSPMRDTGKYIPSIRTDFWGTPRTAPYCIGAHELNIDSMHYSSIMDTLNYRYPNHM